jgi:VWFA-related protein
MRGTRRFCVESVVTRTDYHDCQRNPARVIVLYEQMRPLLFAIFATVLLLPAQQANPPVILKATTRLVMLSVIARDKNNLPATGLTKEDFRIRVNGKTQPISVFSMESSGALPSAPGLTPLPAPTTNQPATVFTNRLPAQSGTPSGVTIILVDTRNTRAADQIYAKAQVVRYLHTLQPTDHIGLYTFGPSLKVLHDYTSDSSGLLAKLNAAKDWTLPDTSERDAT